MSLDQKTCEPCRGGIPPMTVEAARALLKEIPGWELSEDGRRIVRRLKCKHFKEALARVNRIGELAEEVGHHPDLLIHGWNKLDITIYTHKIGGLHENDFILAAKINRLPAP